MQIKTKTENICTAFRKHILVLWELLAYHASSRNLEHELARMMTSHCKKQWRHHHSIGAMKRLLERSKRAYSAKSTLPERSLCVALCRLCRLLKSTIIHYYLPLTPRVSFPTTAISNPFYMSMNRSLESWTLWTLWAWIGLALDPLFGATASVARRAAFLAHARQ